ncbi:hypothetical protein Cylst_3678 [Cylindrospermum stagnale PCC 7417]|uniref:Uncharacterized protein n=1 Tax=Cylindrospermum stagnale PCC 7417 TaxID=56107 RepID=K9X228_9NOST|nr:hypothetical protein [Cylindrospermum stagnale]AFZ25802.1 hypothetical protein Cylst_3678 [Cylindrospermum stagnale PCC 7417]
MKTQIFMLGFFITYTSFALPECKAQSSVNQTDIHKQSQQAMTKQTVEIKFIDIIPRKPPMTELLMDVTLHNHYDQPCWFLLPDNIPDESNYVAIGQGGVISVAVYQPVGKGRVIFGNLVGSANSQAFLLPAGAKLKIRRLPITLWGLENLDKDQLEVEVVVASQLTINGESAEAWFGTNPMSDLQADVTVDKTSRLASRSTGNFKEVPVSVVEKERFKVEVILFGDGKN